MPRIRVYASGQNQFFTMADAGHFQVDGLNNLTIWCADGSTVVFKRWDRYIVIPDVPEPTQVDTPLAS
jgi:hypothetical protein